MAIKCEMCGSTEVIKNGEYFECQYCGCKYSVAEIKRQLNIQTVEIDRSGEAESLMQKADDEYKSEDYDRAKTTYDDYLKIVPDDNYAFFRRAISDVYSHFDANEFTDIDIEYLITTCKKTIPKNDENDITLLSRGTDLFNLADLLHDVTTTQIERDCPDVNEEYVETAAYVLSWVYRICEFICTELCTENKWLNHQILDLYIKSNSLFQKTSSRLIEGIPFIVEQVETSFGIRNVYDTYGFDEKSETRMTLNEMKNKMVLAESFKDMIGSIDNVEELRSSIESRICKGNDRIREIDKRLEELKPVYEQHKRAMFGSKAQIKQQVANEISSLTGEKTSIENNLSPDKKILELLSKLTQ